MKFLLDMNLSPLWVNEFESRNLEATHWSHLGAPDAQDTVIMEYARKHDYIVLTHDLDFGAMLAATNASSPSVLQVRTRDVSPASLAPILFDVIGKFRNELEIGALIVVDRRNNRIRLLPLSK